MASVPAAGMPVERLIHWEEIEEESCCPSTLFVDCFELYERACAGKGTNRLLPLRRREATER